MEGYSDQASTLLPKGKGKFQTMNGYSALKDEYVSRDIDLKENKTMVSSQAANHLSEEELAKTRTSQPESSGKTSAEAIGSREGTDTNEDAMKHQDDEKYKWCCHPLPLQAHPIL
jgi:hypothetical protein